MKVKNEKPLLPFTLDRTSRIKFPYQVADGLRDAILSGYWKGGERLPSSREMKTFLGVSVRAPSEALQMLANEGLIRLREKCGAVVNVRRAKMTKGRVLLVLPSGSQVYGWTVIFERVRERLNEAGYVAVETSVLRRDGTGPYDLTQLANELQKTYSLVVITGGHPEINRKIIANGHTLLAVGSVPAGLKQGIGGIPYSVEEAVRGLMAACSAAGVRNILQVSKWKGENLVLAKLRESGLRVTDWVVPISRGNARPESLWNGAYEAFERRFETEGTDWLPELLYFTDDHCLIGASVSLLSRGIKVPERVRLVTRGNRGWIPPFTTPVACIENDLFEDGNIIAGAILDYFEEGKKPESVMLKAEFNPGGMFGGWCE